MARPFLLELTELLADSFAIVENAASRGEIYSYCSRMIESEEQATHSLDKTDIKIVNLQTQVASVTSAVAETTYSEDEKKLRIRNLHKVVTTPIVYEGDFAVKRANKETRERELKTWLMQIAQDKNFTPSFSVFLIDPRPTHPRRLPPS